MGVQRWWTPFDAARHLCDDELVVLAADYDRDVAEAWQEGALHERQQRVVEAIFFSPGDCAKPFVLQRDADISGVSGEGIVADGVEFPDGCVALRWRGGHPTSVVFHDRGMESVEAIHGHGGNTRIVYVTEDIGERAAEVAEAEARGWNAGLSDPAVREQIIKTLMDEGSESEGGWHSWRCHDKSRYPGPCGCTPAIVDALLAALRKPEVEG